MLDCVSVIMWGITYLLIVFSSKNQVGSPKRAIPLLPPILNLAWELLALVVSGGLWGHIVWFGLSILVFESCLDTMTKKQQCFYFSVFVVSIIVLFFVYAHGGMLVFSFIINVIMSICFLVDRKNLLKKRKVLIAITKGIGTLAATLYYMSTSISVAVMGVLIVILDVVYLVYCVREKKEDEQRANQTCDEEVLFNTMPV